MQVNQTVRYSAGSQGRGETKNWTHLKFFDRIAYTGFLRHLWAAYHDVTSKHMLIHSRMLAVGFSQPSMFTRHCRQYLGEDYFDGLEETDEDAESETEASEGSEQGEGRGIKDATYEVANAGDGEQIAEEEYEEEEPQLAITVDDTDEYGVGAFSWL